MMSELRIQKMREAVEKFPEDPRPRYFLGHELLRAEEWAAAAEQYEAYLRLEPHDEGTGHKNLGLCLARLDRRADAAAAWRRGIEAALAHRHEGLAEEIRSLLADVEG